MCGVLLVLLIDCSSKSGPTRVWDTTSVIDDCASRSGPTRVWGKSYLLVFPLGAVQQERGVLPAVQRGERVKLLVLQCQRRAQEQQTHQCQQIFENLYILCSGLLK